MHQTRQYESPDHRGMACSSFSKSYRWIAAEGQRRGRHGSCKIEGLLILPIQPPVLLSGSLSDSIGSSKVSELCQS